MLAEFPMLLMWNDLKPPHLVIQPRFVRNFTSEEVHQRDDEPVHNEQVLSVPWRGCRQSSRCSDVEQLEVLLGNPVSIRVELHIKVRGPRVAEVVLHGVASSDVVQRRLDGDDDSDQSWE